MKKKCQPRITCSAKLSFKNKCDLESKEPEIHFTEKFVGKDKFIETESISDAYEEEELEGEMGFFFNLNSIRGIII